MKVEPTGVVFIGECEIQSPVCVARTPAAISAVFTTPQRRQVNVCRACLDYMVRNGEWELDGARLAIRTDLAITDENGRPILVAEVKVIPPHEQQSPRAWASRVHRNLLVHAAIPSSPYFLLVAYPLKAYLWTQRFTQDPEALPDFEIDLMREFPEIGDYVHESMGNADGVGIEIAVSKALNDAVHDEFAAARHPWMVKSGLLSDLQKCRTPHDLAA